MEWRRAKKQNSDSEVSLSLEPGDSKQLIDSPKSTDASGNYSDGYEPEDARAFSSTDTYPPRGRYGGKPKDSFGFDKSGQGTSPKAGHNKPRGGYKDVLHAFQMDQDVDGSDYSPRGGDDGSDGGYGGHSTGPDSDGGGFSRRGAKKTAPERRRRSSFNMNVTSGGILRKKGKYGVPNKRGASIDGGSYDGSSDNLKQNTIDNSDGTGGNGTMAMHEVMSAKDTPVGVRRALLERHQILKVRVRTNSSLIGQTAIEIGFRDKYKAAIIAVKRGGEDQRAANEGKLASVVFEAGDILMLHCLDKCPLLQFKEPALGGGERKHGDARNSKRRRRIKRKQAPVRSVGGRGGRLGEVEPGADATRERGRDFRFVGQNGITACYNRTNTVESLAPEELDKLAEHQNRVGR